MKAFYVSIPEDFSFDHCLSFLQRSPKEVLHTCSGGEVTKLLSYDGRLILFALHRHGSDRLRGKILNTEINTRERAYLDDYIHEWFDLRTDLRKFYAIARHDALLKDIVKNYYGYRIVGQPDLFESLTWAILGQQINLQFAYTLKQRFVIQHGERFNYEGKPYYLFPTPQQVASLKESDLLPLQFSKQKARYVINVGEAFAAGSVSKEMLEGMSLQDAKSHLVKIKGIGNWTANYALMKTFRYPDAFPLEDVGIHNAIKKILNMDRKPTLKEVENIFKKYKGWEAYATLYLWKSL